MRWSGPAHGNTSVRFGLGIVNRVQRNAISLAIRQGGCYIFDITASPWLLSVTESVVLPPHSKSGHMSDTHKFNLREWLVPPVLLPVFFALLIVAAVIIRW